MIRTIRIGLATVLVAAGWANGADRQMPAAPPGVPDPRPLVWVVDGAGDLRGCSVALTRANTRGGVPVELSVFPWSHGFPRLLMDHADMAHARAQGKKLALLIRG